MTQITFIISGGTPDYTVSIEGYVGTPMEWIFDVPGEYTIEVEEQESYKLLIEDSEGCLSENYFEYTRPDSLINYYITVRVNFTDETFIVIKDMTPQEACEALNAKCETGIVSGDSGGTGQIANNPPMINDVVYAYWGIDSLIKFSDGTYILTTEWNGSRCGVQKYIGHIENGIITDLVLCVPPTTTTTTTLHPPTTTTTTTPPPPTTTTTSTSSTTTSTTSEPTTTTTSTTVLQYRAAMYVGPSAPDISTETVIPYSENTQIILNSPTLEGINYFFISIPEGKTLTVYDMFMANITSEFEYHSDQQREGYYDNTIYRKMDIYDTTGSTTFYLIIS